MHKLLCRTQACQGPGAMLWYSKACFRVRKHGTQRVLLVALFCSLLCGCAAITNPVANGVPVRRLPPELLGEPKEGARPLPLTLLRQKPPQKYLLAPDDVLGIWVECALGEKNQIPSVNIPESRTLPPS